MSAVCHVHSETENHCVSCGSVVGETLGSQLGPLSSSGHVNTKTKLLALKKKKREQCLS